MDTPGYPHPARTNGHALSGVVGFTLPEAAARFAAPPRDDGPPSREGGARFATGGETPAGHFPPPAGAAGAAGAGGADDGEAEGLRLLGPVGTLAKAQEWLFVLRSVGLEGVVRPVYGGGWGVLVDEARHRRALDTLRTYEAENRDFPPVRRKDRPLYAPSWWALATFAALCAFFLVTGP
ncbi:MAG TPA: hypothetical protein VFS00_31505, partial [Polyangiaceae bacterium]|nr:hypothetical protein [Polyangiaceae bacterium]